ncbi:hypothetical protein KC19_3G138600 [Ceratodon purpureus]|uniref:F-box domain-containing protein n=1 Tax=Ceratodon purpureus TaxID=3225 RepID=A0A8T0IKJ8_CERPU|nr:hypothetical protein KC19_3G138600 [Ceratodon purpureus]
MAQVGHCDTGDQFLTNDVLRDVLDRLDGATLARASCVSKQFRSTGYEEAFWEKLCNERWPSTMEEPVKMLVSTAGGFRKLYNNSFPFILCDSHCGSGEEDKGEAISSSDFVSIVDVTYGGEPVLSRVVEGVSGAIAMCGPLVDILEVGRSESASDGHGAGASKEDDDRPLITIHTKLPRVSSIAQERKDGRFWSALCSHLRLSWILVNRKTQQMVNLGSWKPLGGIRHRPCGDDFLLRFGCILPTSSTPVHCNIVMRCITNTSMAVGSESSEGENAATTVVRVTELGMHLEDVHGVHLRGSQAISLLSRVMNCDKTVDESKVSASYKSFMATQISNQESLVRRENHRQTASAVFFVSVFVIAMSFLV